MNFHTDAWIMDNVKKHYEEALQYFPEENILGVFLQGSQNYGLDTENSDVDTKLIITPTLKEIALNKTPVSTTHIRENNEYIDFKDIRLYCQTFYKQNLNFVEILFTPYFIVNPFYAEEWQILRDHNEEIARMNPYRAVKSMQGIAKEKYFAMEHRYPSKIEILDKYGYDGKQLHHLKRVEYFIISYCNGTNYYDCLHPDDKSANYLKQIKNFCYDLKSARANAKDWIDHIDYICDIAYKIYDKDFENVETRKLIEDVQYRIIEKSIKREISKGE